MKKIFALAAVGIFAVSVSASADAGCFGDVVTAAAEQSTPVSQSLKTATQTATQTSAQTSTPTTKSGS